MTLEYRNGEIFSLDGHGNGVSWSPEEEIVSLKLVGRTVIVNTKEGHHYEYDGLTGDFDKERSSKLVHGRK